MERGMLKREGSYVQCITVSFWTLHCAFDLNSIYSSAGSIIINRVIFKIWTEVAEYPVASNPAVLEAELDCA